MERGNHRKYNVYVCKECDVDFMVRYVRGKTRCFCPYCKDSYYVEIVRTIWMKNPSNYHKRWLDYEDEQIIEYRKRGYTPAEIEIEGRTKSAIERRWRRLREMGLTM